MRFKSNRVVGPPAVICILISAFLTMPGSAAAYQDTGYDPDDRAVVGDDPDIRSTTRRVALAGDGRVLKIKVRAYEDLGVWWRMEVLLDSRRGPRFDFRLVLRNGDVGGSGCSLDRRGGGDDFIEGSFRQAGDRTRCTVPARLVDPDKRIRWRIRSPSGYDEPESVTERAPDHGWYG
jgi:hypothetical protein